MNKAAQLAQMALETVEAALRQNLTPDMRFELERAKAALKLALWPEEDRETVLHLRD